MKFIKRIIRFVKNWILVYRVTIRWEIADVNWGDTSIKDIDKFIVYLKNQLVKEYEGLNKGGITVLERIIKDLVLLKHSKSK